MKISISFKNLEVREPSEKEVDRSLQKLERLLKSYSPDLVQLHGSFDRHPRKTEFEFTLNLSLPTGTLHASGTSPEPRMSVKAAFGELSSQLKRHQSKLRKDYEWKRKRPRTIEVIER